MKDHSIRFSRRITVAALAVMLAALTTLPLLINGCATNAATGKRQLILISESREIAMGQEADKEISAQLGVYPDSGLQMYVNDLGQRMAKLSERPALPWSFKVMDDPIVNAFALPGGYIYVTRGILAHLNNEAELAGVVGHEIGHVTGKHSVARMSSAQIASLGLGVGVILEPRLERFAGAVSQGLGLLFLKYGRDDENEADYLGLRYMRTINKDPRELVGVMNMLNEVTTAAGVGRVPEWLSTHPDPGNRAARIQSFVDTISANLNQSLVNRDEYLKQIDGIVFGQNPRHGYFKESRFFHPDLKFRCDFPTGWQTQNQVQAVVALSPGQDALIQLTMSAAQTHMQAAQNFFAIQDLRVSETQSGNLNGIPASWGKFSIISQDGELRGMAYFYEYGGDVYQILGYGVGEKWSNNEAAVTNSVRSFSKLTDAKALAVQPWRLKIVTLSEPMTISEFVRKFPTPAPEATIALINRADENTKFPKNYKLKSVVGEMLP